MPFERPYLSSTGRRSSVLKKVKYFRTLASQFGAQFVFDGVLINFGKLLV